MVVCRYCGTKFAPDAPPPPVAPPPSSPTITFAIGDTSTPTPSKLGRKGKIGIAVFVVLIILVTTLLPLYFTGVLSPPLTVKASISPGSGPHPLQVSYQATASGGQGPYTYSWDFGDGGTSNTASGSHAYALEGAYSATVTVYDNTGNLVTQTVVVTVLGTLSASPISQVLNVSLPSGLANAQDWPFQVPTVGPVGPGGNAQNVSVSAVFQVLGCTGAPQATCDKAQVAIMTNLQYSQFTSGATVTPLWCPAPTGTGGCTHVSGSSAEVNVSAESGQGLNLVIWDTYAPAVTVFVSENFQLYQIS